MRTINKKEKVMKSKSGITLVSLVLTVIVLLIISGITISTLSGENGVINRAGKTKIEAEVAQIVEKAKREEIRGREIVIDEKYENKLIYISKGEFLYNPENVSNVEKEVFESMNIYSLVDLYVYGTYTNNGKTEARVKGFSDKGLEKLNKGMTKFSIPAKTSDGLEVTALQENAFRYCNTIEEMSFLGNLQTIGRYSFQYCTNLKTVEGLSNVTNIDGGAFGDCYSLSAVKNLDNVTTMGGSVFQKCSNLVTVEGLNNLTSMGSAVFNGCTKLENVSLGKVTEITGFCFRYCENLKNVEIPDTVKKISDVAFGACKSLEKVIIPSSVESIGREVWCDCSSIEEIRIPSSVQTINYNCFLLAGTSESKCYVPFTEAEGAPEGWHAQWFRGNGEIIYADEV